MAQRCALIVNTDIVLTKSAFKAMNQTECGEMNNMRDEELLLNLAEIATWLDSLTVEIGRISKVVENIIAEAPVSVAAWDKVGDRIWG